MTEIAFHFGAPDRLAYTCRLLRKASATGARLLVRSSAQMVGELDKALWNLAPVDFITHCDVTASAALKARSAVLLQSADQPLHAEVPILINLSEDVPQGFEQFQRVIEVVSTDEQDRNQARRRWKRYTELGYTITRHDLATRARE